MGSASRLLRLKRDRESWNLDIMKKKVLIIRSVSFQQLDQNLAALVKEFPSESYELHLLTHNHGIERAKSYEALSAVIDYERRGNFSAFFVPQTLKKKTLKKNIYEAVVVPVTNRTGLGFLNVQWLAFRIPARKILICNMLSELRTVSRPGIVLHGVQSLLFSILAGLGTAVMGLIMIPYLLFRLLVSQKKKK